MSSITFQKTIFALILSGTSLISAQPQDLSNSVYDSGYDQSLYDYQGYYDRQDSFSLGDLSIPMLLTAFVAAFLASLVGSSLASNISRMASLEFKAPEPIAIRAIPIASSREYPGLEDSLKAIGDLVEKYGE